MLVQIKSTDDSRSGCAQCKLGVLSLQLFAASLRRACHRAGVVLFILLF